MQAWHGKTESMGWANIHKSYWRIADSAILKCVLGNDALKCANYPVLMDVIVKQRPK